jgi:hypothetical protein
VIAVRSMKSIIFSVSAAAILVMALGATSAFAEATSPWWGITSGSRPTSLSAGGEGQIVVTAENLGDAGTSGKVTIADQLPAGLEATGITAIAGGNGAVERGQVNCTLKKLTCVYEGTYANFEGEILPKVLPPFEEIEVRITVKVRPEAVSGEVNTATVSGGGATSETVSRPTVVGAPEKFGVEDYQLIPENPGGSLDTQAGSHPFQLTSIVTLNSQTPDAKGGARTVALPKDLSGELPTGLFGNPTPFAQCTDAQFAKQPVTPRDQVINECPPSTAIGVATVTFNEPVIVGFSTLTMPIFNMVPRAGEPARFAFKVAGIVPVFLDASVRTGGDYGVTISSSNIAQIDWLLSVKFTFWGIPGDPRHDAQRGWECLEGFGSCPSSSGKATPPFLVLPTSCEKPFETTIKGDSWGSSARAAETAEPVTYRLPELVDGCNHLPFSPSITVSPDVPAGSTPTGLTVGVHVPQEAALNPEGLSESTLRDTTVALPQGVTLNPGTADGLVACSEQQVGFLAGASHGDQLAFTPDTGACPDASKIATVKIKTPLLPNALEGQVFLAAQSANPFGSLFAMYLLAQDPVSGTIIKLAGEVVPDPVTGQIVTTFKNTAELPFEDLELHFFGGDRAPLATPPLCGSYRTDASFSPWSGEAPVSASSTFNISSGPSGSPCADPLPFSPSLTAGSTNIQSGAFSPFTMTMSRDDGSQNLQAIELKMPPGLLGTLATVKLCPEPLADQGLCPASSQIGETTVSVGLGGNPYTVESGKVYITEGYKGAPYGLSITNPAKAGPADLGSGPCDCVVVRAKIEVDPTTAALNITSDNTGPYKIPSILDGIPLEIKHVNVRITRPGFTFNPTNCSPMAITGKLSSTEGATQALSVPFQVTNCATLAFKPQFKVSTAGKTSRAKGAGLDVKLSYPKAPWGSQANVKSVKVDLPKQLPSRLTTLQKACTAVVFNQNPAACPEGSRIGTAAASTPIIPVGLAGPAYFVSYGGAKFPELVIVLSGYGVTVQLHGETFISKAGITSSTFRTVPDVPIGTFELKLPQGSNSALAANGNLCTSTLKMPTTFTAQNGLVQKQSTPITVTGCSKHKTKKHKNAKRRKKK